ncbi:helicase associated domain-containing protein [Streptomyces sp. NPDC001568]|uniref:helicase associated domain-containing protein n=1 Tax=Streptomyces sp. NPDC001568 TaxID=3364588 RepID=UPI003686265D
MGDSVRLGWDRLTGVQQWLCEQVLGNRAHHRARDRPTPADKWTAHLGAARQFFARDGHPTVPRKHVETVLSENGGELQFRLGSWVKNQRSRAASLSPERVEQLSKLGMRWS